MRRRTLRLFGAVLLMLIVQAPFAAAAAAAGPSGVAASGYELIDFQTGQVLLAHNPNLRLAPASTTKIMTALLTVMQGHLGRVVRVSRQAYGVEGSSAYLVPNQRLTLRELLYGLLLVSGNDAAVELAIADRGSVPAFVAEMNREARALGATHTTFLNPDGLYLPGHLTTAHDLALFTRAALTYPDFRTIDSSKSYYFPGVPKPYTLVNQNILLWNYPGAIGVKIGYTIQAQQSIVAAATRNGVTLIAVALHTNYTHMWQDPQTLLNWGFAQFHTLHLVSAGEDFAKAPRGDGRAVATGGFSWLLGQGQALPGVRVNYDWPEAWRAGQPVGEVVVGPQAKPLAVIPLVASAASPHKAAAGGMLPWAEGGLAAAAGLGIWQLHRRTRHRRYRLRIRRR